MNRKASESAVDRLIALALKEKPAKADASSTAQTEIETVPVFADAGLPPPEELEHHPMWKTLLQLRTFLPYVTRLLEMSGPGQPSTALSHEVRQSVGALESGHRELRLAVQDQSLQMKRMEEAMTRTQEATERNASELTEMTEDLKSMHTLVRRASIVLGVLLLALIGLVVVALVRAPHGLR
jgi:hypothetical protein